MTVFQRVVVEPERLRLDDRALPLHRTAGATAEVTVGGTGYRLRAWTFGERRALLSAYLGGDGTLDAASLSEAALGLLVRPVPAEPADQDVVALAALAWSATGGAAVAPPVPGVEPAAQMVRIAAVTGWSPRDIDGATAADVDRWFAALPGQSATRSAGGTASGAPTAVGPSGGPAAVAASTVGVAGSAGAVAGPSGGVAGAVAADGGDGFRTFRLED